ncbi:MAG: extracellular solute-binding protein [Treponema sp.]|jgi:putative aldouronate transport system substrate-binding protein|nr:extracellular solute-binding protein [Treponema sp.]
MTKRYGAALLCALALLAGCGGSARKERVPLGEDGRYAETLTLSLGRYVTADPRLPAGDTYTDNAYTRYLKDRLNITFVDEFEATGEDFDRQVALSIAAGEIPDIMTVQSEEIIKELINADLIADLSELYARYASPRIREIYDSFGGRCLGKATFGGRLMALPGTRIDDRPFMFWIRQDWLDEAGITLDPDGDHCISLADLETAARAFAARGKGNVGLAFASSLGDELAALAPAFGAFPNTWVRGADGVPRYGSLSDETRACVAQLRAWYESGVLDPQFGTRSWDEITALLINGKLGIVPGQWHVPDWRLPSVRRMDRKAVFMPYAAASPAGALAVTHSDAAERYVVVSKNCANPEAAILLLNILYDEMRSLDSAAYPDLGSYISLGVDNSTKPLWIECDPASSLMDEYQEYREIAAGHIPLDSASTVYRRSIAESILAYQKNPAAADAGEWSYYLSRMEGLRLMYDTAAAGRLAWTTPAFWGQTPTGRQRGGNLQTMQEESFVKIITGAEPLAAFDTFVSRWKAEGGDTITAEIAAVIAAETEARN